MTNNRTSGGRVSWMATAAAVAMLATLIGCTDSGAAPSAVAPTDVGPTYEEDLRELLTTFEWRRLAGELTREDLLDNVAEEDVDEVSVLFYPDDGHPAAGKFIPVEEWEEPQQRAWGIYVTTRGNLGALALEPLLLGLYSHYCND